MIDLKEIKNQLSDSEVVEIIKGFFPDIDVRESSEAIILPTICHNLEPEEGSHKLYYYRNSKLFHCYTHCNESFDIIELIQKILNLRGLDSSLPKVLNIINSKHDLELTPQEIDKYESILTKYSRKGGNPEVTEYDSKILSTFPQIYPIEWIMDGLSVESMKKYNIRFSIPLDQAVIPHYDIEGRLIGIRVRNFDNFLKDQVGKYMPAKINGEFYSHPLMYNLYGININKRAIKTYKTAWIMEGEKSCIITDKWYGDNNLSVAACGDKINKIQLMILLSLGVKEVIICFDRMGETKAKEEEYFNKLYSLCKKYNNYCNFSFVFDRKHILPLKAAPVDTGRENFEKLLKERVIVQ